MKSLHIVPCYKPAYKYGGPVNSVSKLCELLIENGTYVKVLTTTGNGREELDVETGKELMVDGVPVIYFKRYTKNNTFISPGLWRYLYRNVNEYDMVHIHTWWNILVLVSAMICYFKGAKVIISPRGMLCDYIFNGNNSFIKKCIHLFIGKSLLKRSRFHATAVMEYDECEALIPGWDGFIVPNILPLTGPPIQKVPNEVFTIAFLSRIDPKKGLEYVFEAMARLQAEVKLKVYGSGDPDYITDLKQLAKKLNIERKVEWMEWQGADTKFKQLMQADICILTSYNENFGNVIVESLYMGTPVLITDMVGLSSFVKANDLGWITPLDINLISNTILQATLDVEKRERINKTSRQLVEANFAQDILIDEYMRRYRLLINSN
ncbi:XrtY-associated glycosyltransferase XYAG1 [Mucilaginibacter sp. AW1-3]